MKIGKLAMIALSISLLSSGCNKKREESYLHESSNSKVFYLDGVNSTKEIGNSLSHALFETSYLDVNSRNSKIFNSFDEQIKEKLWALEQSFINNVSQEQNQQELKKLIFEREAILPEEFDGYWLYFKNNKDYRKKDVVLGYKKIK